MYNVMDCLEVNKLTQELLQSDQYQAPTPKGTTYKYN